MKVLLHTPLPVLLLALSLLLLPGCGNEQPADGGKPRIALVMKSLANEFFVTMADGARQHQQEHAAEYELIVNGIRNESDLSQQVQLVEQMIATGVDALVIAPADSRALVPVVKRARDAGIVVVNIDNKFDEETLASAGIQVPFVGPDNREGARAIGEHLAATLQRGDEVAILTGIPTAFNAQQRLQGFREAMEAAGMQIVSVQSGEWEQARATAVASAILSEHPNLKAILCSNDNMALGAAASVRQAGRSGAVKIVGFDNISAVQSMIQNGQVLATADQHGDQLAVYGIEYALQLLDGDATPEDRKTPVDLITAASLE